MNKRIVFLFLIALIGDHLLATLARELFIESLNLDPWIEVQLGELIEIIKLFLSRYFYDEK